MKDNGNEFLIISVKPEYAFKILNGDKTIELRKSSPKRIGINGYLILYVTAPIKKVLGIYKILDIIKDNQLNFWKTYGMHTGISEIEFRQYYKNHNTVFGIELEIVKDLTNYSIKLNSLKSVFPNFSPPQTYKYINKQDITFKVLKKLINN